MVSKNPKILHRIYFDNYAPFHDPYDLYLESWRREMPDYEIMLWNASNLDVNENEWTREAAVHGAPVFLAEYFRWKVLREYGGLYLDADCEIVNGKILSGIIDDLYSQDRYDTFCGVEERGNGYPTAQTVGARVGSKLVEFMADLYENRLAPFWPWREQRGLIGPQLMSLFYLHDGINTNTDGFFPGLDKPIIAGRTKIYPQIYFSPKFTLTGDRLDYDKNKTCVYHMFANSNIEFQAGSDHARLQAKPITFRELQDQLAGRTNFPRIFTGDQLETAVGLREDGKLRSTGQKGVLAFGPYISLPTGTYEARIECATRLTAFLKVNITAESGVIKLASRDFTLLPSEGGSAHVICLPFFVGPGGLSGVEASVELETSVEVSISSVTFDQARRQDVFKDAAPLVLHRVYFGFDGKPDMFMRYLETWKEQLPDFEIVHWNATNLDMSANEFVAKCYEERDHAFLTDYFRWRILHDHGGIYLDADTEIVNGESLRKLLIEMNLSSHHDAVIGIDERGGGWYTAHSMISKPGSDLSKFMCRLYDGFGSFVNWRKKGFYFWAPQLVGLYFAEKGINRDGMGTTPDLLEPTILANVKILPQDWFSPLSPSGTADMPFKLNALTSNTTLCHHFACSWHSPDSIYLSHSREKGGQAQALLSEIVQALPMNRSIHLIKIDLIQLRIDEDPDAEFIDRAYQSVLGRGSDPAGLESYATSLAKGLDRHEMVASLIGSGEFKDRYGTNIQSNISEWWSQDEKVISED